MWIDSVRTRRLLRAFGLPGLLVLTAVACGSAGRPPVPVDAPPTRAAQVAPAFAPEVVSSELVVGANRFVLGLVDGATNKPLADAKAHFRFFTLQGNQGTLRFEADARFIAPAREAGLPETVTVTLPNGQKRVQVNAPSDDGVYIAQVSFDQAGSWGVETSFAAPDGRQGVVNAGFTVLAQPVTPAVGSPAPRTRNPTVRDVTDLSQIDSAASPAPQLHQVSVADAIAAHWPALVALLTPGYCESRFCGPSYEIVQKLLPKYGDKAALIDIEVYKDGASRTPSPFASEWHIQTEPYFFVVDRNGLIAAKFEGPTSLAELDEALARVTS
jgi:hypothetical protein